VLPWYCPVKVTALLAPRPEPEVLLLEPVLEPEPMLKPFGMANV
jgi:hypothetical protein